MTRYFTNPVYQRPEFATSVGVVQQFHQRFPNSRIESVADASGKAQGMQSQATTHGGMPTDPKTLTSTQFILKNGF
jgi:hypothetical protein